MKTSRFLLAGLSALALSLSTSVVFAAPSCCVTRGGETLGFAASEPGPFLELGAKESVYSRQVDLFGADKVTLHNPTKVSAQVQVRMVDIDGNARTVAVELAAGDTATFDIPANAVHLLATSREQVELEVAGAGRVKLEGQVSTLAPEPYEICDSNWTLTCDSTATPGCSSYGPFTSFGSIWVVGAKKNVYWNLNTPTSTSYHTINPDGLTATWVPASGSGDGRCPISVTNSLGHKYNVTGASSSFAGGAPAAKGGRFTAPANDVGTQNLTEEICEGPWTLYCNTAKSPGCSGLGPFTHDGTVIVVGATKNVFWNQNTPTGSYTTQAPGGLTATWYPAGTSGDLRCPVEVLNSLGHWYTVVR